MLSRAAPWPACACLGEPCTPQRLRICHCPAQVLLARSVVQRTLRAPCPPNRAPSTGKSAARLPVPAAARPLSSPSFSSTESSAIFLFLFSVCSPDQPSHTLFLLVRLDLFDSSIIFAPLRFSRAYFCRCQFLATAEYLPHRDLRVATTVRPNRPERRVFFSCLRPAQLDRFICRKRFLAFDPTTKNPNPSSKRNFSPFEPGPETHICLAAHIFAPNAHAPMSSGVARSTALRAGGACVRCRKGKTKCVYENGRAPCKNCAKGMHECYLPSESVAHHHGQSPARHAAAHRPARDSLPASGAGPTEARQTTAGAGGSRQHPVIPEK